jgi:hypothetical protein
VALIRQELGRCKECGKLGLMQFTNHEQSQDYCDICKPIVKQRRIHEAISLLAREGVTPPIYENFYNREVKK